MPTLLIPLKLFVISCLVAAIQPATSIAGPGFSQEQKIRETIRRMESRGASVGLYAIKCGSSTVSLSVNGETPRMPASVQKILTTGAALLKYGPEFQFLTRAYATGPIATNGVNGSLVLIGDGDPSLCARWTRGRPESIFQEWADRIIERGILKVTGDVVGDDDLFDDIAQAPGWEEYTNTDWYTAEVSALSFNDNCIDVTVTPGKTVGSQATVSTTPDTKYVTIDTSQLITKGAKGGWVFGLTRPPGSNLLTLKGRPAQGTGSRMESVTIFNPTLYTTRVLKEALERKGIEIQGAARDIDEEEALEIKRRSRAIPSGWTLLATHESPPLSEIVTITNQRSQNLYAELLAKRLGADVLGDGSFEGGSRAIRKVWQDAGVDVSGMGMVDGSGLSRRNQLTAKSVADAFVAMRMHPQGSVFESSLAMAGQSGTLQRRFHKTPLWNNLRGKTGYVGGVRSLAGTARCSDGRILSFAIFVNGPEGVVSGYRVTMDELAAMLMS